MDFLVLKVSLDLMELQVIRVLMVRKVSLVRWVALVQMVRLDLTGS